MKIGVTAPGSSTHLDDAHQLVKAGPKCAHALHRCRRRRLGGSRRSSTATSTRAAHLDLVISKLDADGAIKVLGRHAHRGRHPAVFGGSNPAAVLYLSKKDFVDASRRPSRWLTDALYRTLKWIEKARPSIAAAVPEACNIGSATRPSI